MQQPDNLTSDTLDGEVLTDGEAVTVNGGEPDGPEVAETARPVAQPVSEVAELKEKYLRLYADFENFRRRTAKENLI